MVSCRRHQGKVVEGFTAEGVVELHYDASGNSSTLELAPYFSRSLGGTLPESPLELLFSFVLSRGADSLYAYGAQKDVRFV